MKICHYPLLILIVALLILPVSCSDEGSSDSGGIGGSGIISTGAVTDIGSVWVNGRRFDTRDARVYLGGTRVGAGDQAIEQWISPGQIVRINGRTTDNGDNAQRVDYAPLIVGAIQEIQIVDDTTLRIRVLEQFIIIDQYTHLNNMTIDNAALGNVVEVSGYSDDTGSIQATYAIRLFDSPTGETVLRLTGTVSNLNLQAGTFYINDQAVDFNQAEIPDVPDLAEGLVVTMTGSLDYSGAVFVANTIMAFQRLDDTDVEQIEIEGIIQADLDGDQFILDDQPVTITENTRFVGGEADDLLAGAMVEAEGSHADGFLYASKIKFGRIFKAESKVAAKDEAQETVLLSGLEGLTIRTNQLTRFQGQLSSEGFDGLEPGRHLVISGHHVDDQHVLASRIIGLPDSQDKALLRGLVQSIDGDTITISGVAFDTDDIPSDGFFLDDEEPVDGETFINEIMPGQWVTAYGEVLDDQSVVWDKLALITVE